MSRMRRGSTLPRVAHIGWLVSCHLARRAQGLADLGLEQLVITDSIPAHLQGRSLPYRVAVLPAGLRARPLEAVAWVEEQLAAFGADALHIHSTHFPAVLGMFCRTVPRMTTIWDFVYSRDPVSPLWHRAILDDLRSGAAAEIVSFSSRVVMEEWTGQGLDPARARWHSWGLDPEVFAPRPESVRAGLRARLGLDPARKIVLSSRTPSLPANVDLLLQAMPRLSTDAHCLVTGHVMPPESRYLEPLALRPEIADRLTFLDCLRDNAALADLYATADVVVSLHANDHNPATVLETMACGRIPLVAPAATVEYWVRDGETGFVTPPRGLDGLVTTLDRALSLAPEVRDEMGRRGRERILAEANFHATLARVRDDYVCLAGMARASRSLDERRLGLLHDACGCEAEALTFYRAAAGNNGHGPALRGLLEEKLAATGTPDPGLFHAARHDPTTRALATAPTHERADTAARLSTPMHLYWHDHLAGLHPLAAAGDVAGYLDCLGHMQRAMHVRPEVFVGESVNWYGGRWGMWSFCAELLLASTAAGGCLTDAAARTLAALPGDDPRAGELAARLDAWGKREFGFIHPELDRRFRKEPLLAFAAREAGSNMGGGASDASVSGHQTPDISTAGCGCAARPAPTDTQP